MHWTICGLNSQRFSTPEPQKNVFLVESVFFRELRLSLGHIGQQALGSRVSQLQNGVPTSSLPPFSTSLLITHDPTRFTMGILEVVKWQTSRAAYNGPTHFKNGPRVTN